MLYFRGLYNIYISRDVIFEHPSTFRVVIADDDDGKILFSVNVHTFTWLLILGNSLSKACMYIIQIRTQNVCLKFNYTL